MPTDWEDQYRRGDTPWEKRGPSPGLVDLLAQDPVRGRVFVPGCGFGHDVRALAATAEEVVGLDIASAAIAGAERFPRAGTERYELGDLFNLDPTMRATFDVVWEHTCFCAIDLSMRAAYVDAVAGALKPRGMLLAIFYLDPGHSSPDEGPPFGVSIAELDRLFLPCFDLVREWLPARAYPGREGREWMRILRRRD
jgi:SAM-dependent methyltransferase